MSLLPLTNAKPALSAASRLPLAAGFHLTIAELETFNDSVDYKLRCAEYYFERLTEQLQDFPAHAFGRGGGPNVFLVNVFLDGFLTATVSASDVFGREINLYFGRLQMQPRFYLNDVLISLRAAAKGATLVNHLQPAVDPNWQPRGLIPRLKTYRNCSAHSRLIETATVLSGTLTYSAQKTGTVPELKPLCYLPDDPEVFPCTYNQQVEVADFCAKSLADLAAVLDGAYAIVAVELAAAPSLPL